MCRMGFVSSIQPVDHTTTIKNASRFYSNENPDGFGFAYLYNGRIIFYDKSGESARQFWSRMNGSVRIVSNLALFHDRRASVGSITSMNTHPFVQNNVALAHNGTLQNYQKLKEFLISKGFKFASQTDSEVLLGVWYYYTIHFPQVLQKWGVAGSVTTIILTPSGIYLFTNNSAMVVYRYKDQILGFSDDRILGKNNAYHLQNNVLYRVVGNRIQPVKI